MTNDRQIRPVDVQLRNRVVDPRDRDLRTRYPGRAVARRPKELHTLGGNNDERREGFTRARARRI